MRLLTKPRKMPSMAGFDLEVTGYVSEPPRAPRLSRDACRSTARPDVRGERYRVGIVLSRFNPTIGDGLPGVAPFAQAGVHDDRVIITVPGA
jgi:hypothetical protein